MFAKILKKISKVCYLIENNSIDINQSWGVASLNDCKKRGKVIWKISSYIEDYIMDIYNVYTTSQASSVQNV